MAAEVRDFFEKKSEAKLLEHKDGVVSKAFFFFFLFLFVERILIRGLCECKWPCNNYN
jgi:hypothetical protein